LDSLSQEEKSKTLFIVERKTPICWMNPTQELKNETEIGSSKHTVPNIVYADGNTNSPIFPFPNNTIHNNN
jgi:hypothetical protein